MNWPHAVQTSVSLVLFLVLVVLLVRSEARVAELERRVAELNTSLVQFSVPLDETVRDVSTLYGEVEALKQATATTGSVSEEPAKQASAFAAAQRQAPVRPRPVAVPRPMTIVAQSEDADSTMPKPDPYSYGQYKPLQPNGVAHTPFPDESD